MRIVLGCLQCSSVLGIVAHPRRRRSDACPPGRRCDSRKEFDQRCPASSAAAIGRTTKQFDTEICPDPRVSGDVNRALVLEHRVSAIKKLARLSSVTIDFDRELPDLGDCGDAIAFIYGK